MILKVCLVVALFQIIPGKIFLEKSQSIDNNVCAKVIKYQINKIAVLSDGKEYKTDVKIVIDPSQKKIHLTSESEKKKKTISFITEITSIKCDFAEDLKTGSAVYSGYTIQSDGRKSNSRIEMVAKNGELTIYESDPSAGREPKFYWIVSKWEYVQ